MIPFKMLIAVAMITGIGLDQIRSTNQWIGKSRDETHKNAAPNNGIIKDGAQFKELWSKWHPNRPMPKVDFSKDFIVAATVPGPNRVIIGRRFELTNGDVTFRPAASRMGGPGFGHVMAQFERERVSSVNGIPVTTAKEYGKPEDQPAESVDSDIVNVDVIGNLRTGIVAIGAETTGVTITSGNIMWELKLSGELAERAKSLNGKRVRVTGTLTAKRGVEIAQRMIVLVRSLEAVGVAMNREGTFKQIRVEQSGGIAGMMLTTVVTPDGKVVSEDLKGQIPDTTKQLTNDVLKELHELVGSTDWKKVDASNLTSLVSDGFNYEITIETNDGRLRSVLNTGTMPKFPNAAKLLRILGR